MDNIIKIGEYIIIKRQNYMKLHKLNKPNSCIMLGRDSINLTGVEGNHYFSIFKMMPSGGKRNKEYVLELAEESVNLKDEIDVKVSGTDNRNIFDDGQSQKLTAAEIETLKNDSNKASDIVETLITNSNTFHSKTEYSQEKYLRKKEKKYFDYLQILKPNLRTITEVLYRLDPNKIQGIRIDTLSQILTLTNVYSEGNHLLYDSGSNGLLTAALLSVIGQKTNGKVIHMHPGNMSQKQALLAMNFDSEQMNRCVSVNVYSVLRQINQGCDTNSNEKSVENNPCNPLKRKNDETIPHKNKISKLEGEESLEGDGDINTNENADPKKPKWHFDNLYASELLQGKVDSLVIACKEDPQNIFNELVQFVKPGRPFVIYYPVAEPLQRLYMSLKSQPNTAALKLTTNWMRNYQVLPDRTHPEVTMNAAGGFLLSGYVLK